MFTTPSTNWFLAAGDQCIKGCLDGTDSRVQGWWSWIKKGISVLNTILNLQVEGDAPAGNSSLDAPSFATGYCVAKCGAQ